MSAEQLWSDEDATREEKIGSMLGTLWLTRAVLVSTTRQTRVF